MKQQVYSNFANIFRKKIKYRKNASSRKTDITVFIESGMDPRIRKSAHKTKPAIKTISQESVPILKLSLNALR